MPRYMAANYHHWCEFALSKNFEIGGPTYEGPILVRGWVKSSGWGVAAWDSGGPPCSVSVSCSSAESPTSGVSFQVSEQSSGTHFRSGPHLRSERPTSRPFPESHSIPEAMGHSQCVFLSYYKAKSRKEFTPQVMKTLEDQKQERSNVEVDHAEGSHKVCR